VHHQRRGALGPRGVRSETGLGRTVPVALARLPGRATRRPAFGGRAGMNDTVIIIALVGGVLLIPLIWLAATFNRFVRLRQHIRESWADIDVELKRRHDLIPNLVQTVQGYAT